MGKTISETIQIFIDKGDKEFQRFNSWDTCFNYFQQEYFKNKSNDDTAALHLGFYLASWGMYRGSTFLLQNDYTIHIGIVKILKKYYSESTEVDYATIEKIGDEITNYYQSKAHPNTKNNNTASVTLITKILLGTFSCIPAYDRFFIDGLGIENDKNPESNLDKNFNVNSFRSLNKFYEKNQKEFMLFGERYPKMKLLDMYFWQLGNDNE